jgi:quinol monooxygenase YgiN
MTMVIVAGHVMVDEKARDEYLRGCREVIAAARSTPGCLDFAISADVLDPCRINIFERWDSQTAVEAFRGGGVDPEQGSAIRFASVAEYDTAEVRVLT